MFKMILIDFIFPCSSLAKQKRNETKTWVMPTRCDMHTVIVYYATYWRHGMKGEYIGFKTKLFPSLNLISVWNFVIFQSSLSVPWKKILLVKQNFIFFLVAWALKVSIYFITDHRIWFNCPCTNLTPFLSTDKISYWRSLVTFTQCLKVPDPFLRPCSKQHSFFH